MSLATRCPNCNTLLKVSSGQLQLHEGKVRCGQCKTVFSGIEHLTSADTEAWQHLELGTKPYVSDHNLTGGDGTDSENLFAHSPPPNKPLIDFKQGNPSLKVACLILLGILVLQSLWWNRIELIQKIPTLAKTINHAKPSLQRLFATLGTQSLVVEGSGLQALDEHNLRVDLTLRNTNPLPSQWPHLKIDLLDTQGLVLASKLLSPSDYQLRDKSTASVEPPIPGQKTIEILAYLNLIALNTQLPESVTTGFRIELYDQGPRDN
jgi:predicted Zn finger-like uncharacterized protein